MTTRPFLGLPLFGRGHITGRSATFWADRPLFGRSATGRSLWSIKAMKFWLQVSLAQNFLGKAFMSKILITHYYGLGGYFPKGRKWLSCYDLHPDITEAQ